VNRQHDRQSVCCGSANRRKRSNSLGRNYCCETCFAEAEKKACLLEMWTIISNSSCGRDWTYRSGAPRSRACLSPKNLPTPLHSNHHRSERVGRGGQLEGSHGVEAAVVRGFSSRRARRYVMRGSRRGSNSLGSRGD
jgi:hypothetical protein